MFFQKKNFSKMPTSKIIYNLTYQNEQQIEKSNLENILYKRLEKVYKLEKNIIKKFIKKEQETILTRGNLLEEYLFEGEKTVEEALSKYYTKIEKINMSVKADDSFTDLTFSELAVVSSLFDLFDSKLTARQIKLATAEKKEFDADDSRVLLEKLYTEEMLVKYYKVLKKCTDSQMLLMLDYKQLDENSKNSLAIKELKYLKKQVKLFPAFFSNYTDLTFDVFSQNEQLAKRSNVSSPVFRKIK